MNDVKHPDIDVKLSGLDGNVYVLGGAVGRAMRQAGIPDAEIKEFYTEISASQSYDEALQVMQRWVSVS